MEAARGERPGIGIRIVSQAAQLQLVQAHRQPQRQHRLLRIGVVERGHLVLRVAQVRHREHLPQRRRGWQLALRGQQAHAVQRRHAPLLAEQRQRLARAQRLRRRRRPVRRHIEHHHVLVVVLRQPAAGAVGEQRVPLVPAAVDVVLTARLCEAWTVAVLQAPDQGEGAPLPLPGCAQLQRRMVGEQLGALADLAQGVAVAQHGAAAVAAHRHRRGGGLERHRRAAVGARRLPAALRPGRGRRAGAGSFSHVSVS